MKTKIALATMMALAAAIPAHADECGDGLVEVEQALTSTNLTDDDKAKAGDLLAQAKDKQAAGDNNACATLLAEAKKIVTAQ
jgi:hypothetical protein